MHLVSMNLTEKSKLNGFNEHNYVVSKRNPCQIEEKRKKRSASLCIYRLVILCCFVNCEWLSLKNFFPAIEHGGCENVFHHHELLGVHGTQRNITCLCQQSQSFRPNFCVQHTSPKLIQHLPLKYILVLVLRIFGGFLNWSAI